MKNLFKLKHLLLKNFNNQNIYINVIEDNTSNFLIENATIKIEKNSISFYQNNNLRFSINLKDVLKIKNSHFQIIFYLSDKKIEIEI